MKGRAVCLGALALVLLGSGLAGGDAFHAPAGLHDLAVAPADVTIYGLEEHGNLGHSAVSGDVNGDGLDDIIVGARGLATPQPGTVYVIFGPASPASRIIDAATEADVVIIGEAGGDFFGWSSTVGDFNGDQVDDFAVGAQQQPGGPGQIHVFLGPVVSGLTIDLSVESADLTVLGPDPGDELGWSLSSGDFNGDGLDDLLMGARRGDGPEGLRTDAGEVHVVLGYAAMGDPAPEIRDLAVSGESDFTVFGADTADRLAENVAVGDVNGDGWDDLLIGAALADGPDNDRDGAGEAYVILGASSLPESPLDLATTSADLTVYGEKAATFLGFSVAAGNLNGDSAGGESLDDFIIGAREQGAETGEALVILGSETLGAMGGETIDLASQSVDVRIIGVKDGDLLGHLVAAGDFNGDGKDDLFVSARDGSDLQQAGEAYVILGSSGLGVPKETIDLATGADLTVRDQTWDRVGSGTSLTFGDLNGDGSDELMVMTPKADGPGTGFCQFAGIGDRCNAGELHVFFFDDADGDGIGDAVDSCHACDDDDDGDLVPDVDETWCGADPLNGNERPERVDGFFAGHDDDGDFTVDEGLPLGADQYDCDGDGYTGEVEDHVYSYIGQLDGDQKACQEYDTNFTVVDPNQTAATPSLRWPSDFNNATTPLDSFNKITLLDLTSFLAPVKYFGTNLGTNPGDARWDLTPGKGVFATDINVQDITAMIAGPSGNPPMLGGAKALGGPVCPWAP